MMKVNIAIGEPLGAGSGSISAEKASVEEQHELASKVPDFLVAVRDGAYGVCGDGRGCIHMLTQEEPQPEPCPSVFGGPLLTAYAGAELTPGYFGAKGTQAGSERMVEVRDTLVSGGIVLGAHVSDGAIAKTDGTFVNPTTGLPETGCGADDMFVSIMEKPAENATFITDTTAALLGETFDDTFMQFTDAQTVRGHVKDHNPRNALNLVASEDEGRNVEVLTGAHEEALVVFNYVEGMTVDRDALVAATGKQVFAVDMWYIDKLAHAMAQGRPDAPEMYQKLRHAMVAFQVSTYLTLCDGSHRPVLLKPEEQPALTPSVR